MALAWISGRLYYLQSIRRRGRVTSMCLGSGDAALAVARFAIEARAEKARLRREAQHRERAERALCQAEHDRGDSVRRLVAACLEGFGFVRYTRNPWKRRRMSMSTNR